MTPVRPHVRVRVLACRVLALRVVTGVGAIVGAGPVHAAPQHDIVAESLNDGGSHAQEWITVMSCAYFVDPVTGAVGQLLGGGEDMACSPNSERLA
ncbi:hypothetical protein ACFV4F_27080 [Kitasatospora sp. NPDC059722]|uniref:hypothetical protein n=1 Tax=Kitasatospora sp. NPDC059722 TaxID=3346925 RepID=UPI0036793511